MSYVIYFPIDRFSLISTGPLNILDFFSLEAVLSFTFGEPCYLILEFVITLFVFVITYVIHSSQTN